MSLPRIKLISFALCPFVQRSIITLLEKEVPYEIEYINLDNPPAWFHEVSPLEKVPVLLVDDEPLFESMAICEFLDEITPGSLYPEDPFARAKNRAWIEFGNELLGAVYSYATTGEETGYKQNLMTVKDRLETLDEFFAGGPYFNGEEFSLVDAVYAPIFRMLRCLEGLQEQNVYEDAPKIARWADTLLQRPSVINAVPASYNDDYCARIQSSGSVFAQKAGV
ncbi:glutathione S-transferase family protein [Thiohalophilus thiocyanatoxydans]|uniref:glutathione transferase n=1 Tax=Thiohalophilus thiocyanatoxydans TaxID=381308 RepID=A0A4R8IJN0_9GAMM|nr:glutathione S-transferase family protein [Thiohalophilus thiocyanatoxydans]TDY00931.1 glutathione S-transferase [Thiohalophilus thiocyanatoxydans]